MNIARASQTLLAAGTLLLVAALAPRAWAAAPDEDEAPEVEGGDEAPADPDLESNEEDAPADVVVVRDGLGSHDPAVYGPFRLKNGLVLPYPLDNVFRGFAECRRGRHRHPALDIGGVGPSWGLGTPVWSMARAKVVAIGTPEANPERFGRRLTRRDKVKRGARWLPTSAVLPTYGPVHFFTSNYGKSRTGVVITTRVLEGRLSGYTVTYMHLAAIHPDVKVGDVVEAGQEIGAMGGTAVLESAPHVHIAIHTATDTAVDVGPLLGIGATRAACRSGKRAELTLRAAYSKAAQRLMAKLRKGARETQEVDRAPTRCGTWTVEGSFAPVSGERPQHHRYPVPAITATTRVRVERTAGRWQPKLSLEDAWGNTIWTGSRANRKDARRYGLAESKSGRRGDAAQLDLAPREEESVSAVISSWGSKRPPSDARYRLTITRPCPESAPPR